MNAGQSQPTRERGAILLLALILITAVGLLVLALLNQSQGSIATTQAVRDATRAVYSADGAANVAINTLRQGTFNYSTSTNNNCFGTSGLALNNFYTGTKPGQSTSSTTSAYVTCTAEPGTGAQGTPVPISSANKPGQAILTLGTGGETGQLYGQSNKQVTIHGAVTSDSNIDSTSAQLNVTGGVQVQAVSGCTGSVTPACTSLASPLLDPAYAAPTDTPATPTLPSCSNKNQVAEFKPGYYADANVFNNCKASWIHLDPGTYYFNFASGTPWTIGGASSVVTNVVGGTLTSAQTNTAPAVPGACVNPLNSTSAVGVELVFGGASQIVFASKASAEFCASYHSSSPPMVAYGLKSSVGSGSTMVPAQSGCTTTEGSGGCDTISTSSTGSQPTFFFEGLAYVPRGSINLSVTNTSQPIFNFGIIARRLVLNITGSGCSTCAYISLPDNSPGYGITRTVVDLTVYLCSGQSTCSATIGRKSLTARVLIYDPTGTPVAKQRQITVLSWAATR